MSEVFFDLGYTNPYIKNPDLNGGKESKEPSITPPPRSRFSRPIRPERLPARLPTEEQRLVGLGHIATCRELLDSPRSSSKPEEPTTSAPEDVSGGGRTIITGWTQLDDGTLVSPDASYAELGGDIIPVPPKYYDQ